MPDYKKMYLTLLDATEKAMELLIAAQQTCEELYIGDTPDGNGGEDAKNSESGS